jgi:D-serine deaminase-like pyridoxal phosphate-dependent protein
VLTPLQTRVPVSELLTPCALIDGPRLHANVGALQERITGVGAALRPHFKTHRTARIAELQLEAGAIGLTVATGRQLSFVRQEFDCPVLVSSLLQSDASVAGPLREACLAGAVVFAIESAASAELLRAALGSDLEAEVMIEIETGCLRTGIEPAECGEVARAAARLGLRVVGVFSYPGSGYLPGQAEQASEQEQSALALAAAELSRAGFEPEHVSAGSTPTIRFARSGAVTEYRPGTYIFGDRQQLNLGAVERSQLSLTVLATVVARHGDRVVLDAGGKALGRDAPRWLEGYGELLDTPGALVTRLYDHHAVIEGYGGPPLAVGDRVAVLPNNANSVMALTRSAWLTDGGELASELTPVPDR